MRKVIVGISRNRHHPIKRTGQRIHSSQQGNQLKEKITEGDGSQGRDTISEKGGVIVWGGARKPCWKKTSRQRGWKIFKGTANRSGHPMKSPALGGGIAPPSIRGAYPGRDRFGKEY